MAELEGNTDVSVNNNAAGEEPQAPQAPEVAAGAETAVEAPQIPQAPEVAAIRKGTGQKIRGEVAEDPAVVAARRLEESARQLVAEMNATLSGIGADLGIDSEAYAQAIRVLADGYFPAFTENVRPDERESRSDEDTRMSAAANVYNAECSLNQLSKFGVQAGDVITLKHLLANWDNLRRHNPVLAAKVSAELVALLPKPPAVKDPVRTEGRESDEEAFFGHEGGEAQPAIRGGVRGLVIKALGGAIGVGQGLLDRAKTKFPGFIH